MAFSRRARLLAAAALLVLAVVAGFYAVSTAMAPRLEFEVAGVAPDLGEGVVRVVVKVRNPTPIDYRVEVVQAIISLGGGYSVTARSGDPAVVPAYGTAAVELYFDLGLSEIIALMSSEGRAHVDLVASAKPLLGPLELPSVRISKQVSSG